ncbi:MAG: peptide-methionine (S)-S-oxide reductase MsrA [Planctomycetaceae bacterium]|nr:peptide-methionine (S)-S-oxide reductase MsrA [Planctomycetaceae bacterium]
MTLETATLGGGCFWCLEAVFEPLRGVQKVVSGYAGGTSENPSYRDVCTGATGHAEVVQVTFDPGVIPFRNLLEIFFAMHDPTTVNRQGADVGTQYRSVIFWHNEEQRRTAETVISELNAAKTFDHAIVTQVAPLPTFYAAEDYHQGYYRSNPSQGYCVAVINPKVAKLRAKYADRL